LSCSWRRIAAHSSSGSVSASRPFLAQLAAKIEGFEKGYYKDRPWLGASARQ